MHGQEFSMNNDAAHIFLFLFFIFSPRAAVINKQFDMSDDDASWRQAEDAEVLGREVSCIR